ncbi:MAG: BrnA antitoxin family protein [Fibromonadales bacterium]|nr:BrnA antitoxin family protein [Fibromonadales bacterium]
MSSRKTIDPEYYETHDFGDEFAEAAKKDALLRPRSGKNAIEIARERYLAQKKSETVSMRLPKPLIVTIKRQAKQASIPWTSYMREVLEAGVNRMARA